MISFDDLMKKIHLNSDLILTKMGYVNEDRSKDALEFSKHLYETKCWFARISWKNKKRFLLDLIDEIQSVWTLSLLLRSIWNCRPKDAISSISELKTWSIYDQVPMDHDRTVPISSLQQTMTNDREWFRSLGSEQQYLVLVELLLVAGGPLMWEVLKVSQGVYEKHQELQLDNLEECVVVYEPPPDKKAPVVEMQPKKEQTPRKRNSASQFFEPSRDQIMNGQAQKELETNLAMWGSAIKGMKDNLKLEEIEMIFKDGTKQRNWKVNRPKVEFLDTVDFIQLLPSVIGKQILMQLPLTQLSDCARVNRYWAYLVDEIRSELAARQKIDIELEKLRDNMLRHDGNLGHLSKTIYSSEADTSSAKTKTKSIDSCERKPGAFSKKMAIKRPNTLRIADLPFRNMTDLNERLERRGAADVNLRKWCSNVCKINKEQGGQEIKIGEGLEILKNLQFPCPLLPNVKIPIQPPLVMDPALNISAHRKKKSDAAEEK